MVPEFTGYGYNLQPLESLGLESSLPLPSSLDPRY